MLGEIAVEVAIIGGEHERFCVGGIDTEILRRISVPRSGERTNARHDFLIVAVHQAQASFGVQADKFLHVYTLPPVASA